MAFNTAEGRAEYSASSGQTLFTFNFKIYRTSDIEVYLTPAGTTPDDTTDILTETTDYTVSIDGDNGGSVTLVTPATLNDAVTFVRVLPNTRDTEYQALGDLYANTLNMDQNYQTYLLKDRETTANRHVSIPKSAQGVSVELPDVAPLNFFQWNSDGTAIQNVSSLQADGFIWTAADVYNKTEVDDLIDINSYTEKTTPVDADELALADSAATFSLKKLTWANLKATLKTYLDTLYAVLPSSVSVTGTATFTNTTNNISLTGIGSIGLEVGDVITVSGSVSNDKEFTVEAITDANNIIVNQAHAGGTTTKSLVNETVSVSVSLLSKYYNAPIGLGQGWVNVISARTLGVTYNNNTNRSIEISIEASATSTSITPTVNALALVRALFNKSLIVPISATYSISASAAISVWQELR